MENFWNKVNKTDTCWIWTGNRTFKEGYGRIRVNGVPQVAHRVSWQLAYGEIPASHVIDHLCGVKYCVNPAHLEPVTHSENVRRGDLTKPRSSRAPKSGRPRNPDGTFTHCPQNHPYAGDNLYIRPSGARSCRRCQADAQARRSKS